MTAEVIAKTIKDVTEGRIGYAVPDFPLGAPMGAIPSPDSIKQMVLPYIIDGSIPISEIPIVDASKLLPTLGEVFLAADFDCVSPPWDVAALGFTIPPDFSLVDGDGVRPYTQVMFLASYDFARDETRHFASGFRDYLRDGCLRAGDDPERIRWAVLGESVVQLPGAPLVIGPSHHHVLAVYDDGTPIWGNTHRAGWEKEPGTVDISQSVMLAALNFLNCRNVELVEPTRPRAERRRLERIGIRVSEINVFPIGKRSTTASGAASVGVPLTSVRGHFAEYGINGKGLLFGKYEGRFWIPQHARGDRAIGEVTQSFELNPELP